MELFTRPIDVKARDGRLYQAVPAEKIGSK